jgi:hypothetical protein
VAPQAFICPAGGCIDAANLVSPKFSRQKEDYVSVLIQCDLKGDLVPQQGTAHGTNEFSPCFVLLFFLPFPMPILPEVLRRVLSALAGK